VNIIYTIEELVINDSFINFCHRDNEADIRNWEDYLLTWPEQRETTEEARKFVFEIETMLRERERSGALSQFQQPLLQNKLTSQWQEEVLQTAQQPQKQRFLWLAAASVLLVAGAYIVWLRFDRGDRITIPTPGTVISRYETKTADKKTVWLPDKTKVILNAETSLQLAADFGQDDRKVTLSGEAFFEVAHNAQKPFIVYTPSYEVKVLGTSFNVKAYPEDKASETTLLSGSIELTLKNEKDRKFLLKPNEKAILYNNARVLPKPSANEYYQNIPDKISIKNIAGNKIDSVLTEIAWVQNRLEIANQRFIDMRPILERKYGVTIRFGEAAVADYQFTAAFENETIEQVLNALKLSYPFNYRIENKIVFISK
jgi:ferric-dicitrate binding protein FerR (iron transport regulator)